MSKILTFSKHALRNATHLQVMRNCVEYANTLAGISDQRFLNVKATLLAAIDKEDDLFQISQGSKYTKQIEDADKTRDRAYSIICNVSSAFADGYGPDDYVEPAQKIQELINKYKVKNDEQYVQQTGMVNEFVQHATDIKPAFNALKLDRVLETLHSANAEVNDFIMKRQIERAEVAIGALKEARIATDAAYDSFIQYIEALSIITPSAAIDKFMKEWNSYINYVRVQILKTDSAKADTAPVPEDTPDAPAPVPEGSPEGSQSPVPEGSPDGSPDDGSTINGGNAEW